MHQNSTQRLFTNIDRVFRPNDANDLNRKEPNSIKKLKKGDACFSTIKKILGWMVNSISKTIHIAATRLAKVRALLNTVRGQQRTSQKIWHRLLGTLRSLAPGIPGCRGLFSILQAAMPKCFSRVRLDAGVHETLHLWESLLANMHERSTHLRELFPEAPSWFGATDACGHGLGGVFFNNTGKPFVWQLPLPHTVT